MSDLSIGSFSFEDVPTAEIEAIEAVYGALADDVRQIVDLTIRSRVDDTRVQRARALLQEAAAVLREDAPEGPAGVHYNAEGRSWNWGNTVVGLRNAMAPPVRLSWNDDDTVSAALTLGAPYEGPPGCVHGGVSALLLDHLMGETGSARHTRVTVTGTLTLRYVHPLPLGPVRMSARIAGAEGRKVTVEAWIAPDDGVAGSEPVPAVEARGLFIVPSWAWNPDVAPDIGSLD